MGNSICWKATEEDGTKKQKKDNARRVSMSLKSVGSGDNNNNKQEMTTPRKKSKSPRTSTPTKTQLNPDPEGPVMQSKPKKNDKKQDGFSNKNVEKFWNKYKADLGDDEEGMEEMMTAEGIEKLCQDLELDPEDPVLLAFACRVNSSELGCFYKTEFVPALEKLKLDSIESIKNYLVTLRKEMDDPGHLKGIHKASFNLGKEPDQKVLAVNMAIGLINLLLANRYFHAKHFVEFLQTQTSVKALNLDQWENLFDFCGSIKDDCSNYDENAAWPCILDDYVQWLKEDDEGAEGAAGEGL